MALSLESEKHEEKISMNADFPASEVQQSEIISEIKDEPPFEEEKVIHEMHIDQIPESNDIQQMMDEMPENRDIQRIKDNPNRRRSLRNEQASGRKVKPAKYDEIFNCYKRKEFKECIIYIDLVSETTKDCIEYQILKATCLINLNIKLQEAHR